MEYLCEDEVDYIGASCRRADAHHEPERSAEQASREQRRGQGIVGHTVDAGDTLEDLEEQRIDDRRHDGGHNERFTENYKPEQEHQNIKDQHEHRYVDLRYQIAHNYTDTGRPAHDYIVRYDERRNEEREQGVARDDTRRRQNDVFRFLFYV